MGLIFVESDQKTNVNGLFFYRYPLEENVRENEAEDQRCLAQVEEILEAKNKGPVPCVGIIVEPIQSEGGDHHGSPAWFQGLQGNFYQIINFWLLKVAKSQRVFSKPFHLHIIEPNYSLPTCSID